MNIESILVGSVVLILCATIVFLSRMLYKRQKYDLAALALVVMGAGLYLFMASTPYLQPWDERYHALVAKNLIQHPLLPTLYDNPVLPYDYKQWAGNHIWVHKQPVTLWGMALSIKVFGTNVLAVRLPSVLMAASTVYITYSIGRKLFNPRVGLIAAFFFAINGLIFDLVGARMATDHVDVFFMFFVTLSVLCAINFTQSKKIWWNLLCGVFVGAAILCKWLPALIVLPIWLSLVLHYQWRFKQFFFHGLLLVSVIILVALPWQLYIHAKFPLESAWESKYNVMHLYQDLENTSKPFYYYADVMRVSFGELIYLPFVWVILQGYRRKNDGRYWALLIWIVIPFLFFSFSATKLQGYIAFCTTALFIVAAVFTDGVLKKEIIIQRKWLRYTILVLLIGLPVRYSLERLKPFSGIPQSTDWQSDILEFANTPANTSNAVIFNTEHPIEFMYHTHATAYIGIPLQKTVDSLQLAGYDVYVVRKGNIPEMW